VARGIAVRKSQALAHIAHLQRIKEFLLPMLLGVGYGEEEDSYNFRMADLKY
jgi:hypothetical protein